MSAGNSSAANRTIMAMTQISSSTVNATPRFDLGLVLISSNCAEYCQFLVLPARRIRGNIVRILAERREFGHDKPRRGE